MSKEKFLSLLDKKEFPEKEINEAIEDIDISQPPQNIYQRIFELMITEDDDERSRVKYKKEAIEIVSKMTEEAKEKIYKVIREEEQKFDSDIKTIEKYLIPDFFGKGITAMEMYVENALKQAKKNNEDLVEARIKAKLEWDAMKNTEKKEWEDLKKQNDFFWEEIQTKYDKTPKYNECNLKKYVGTLSLENENKMTEDEKKKWRRQEMFKVRNLYKKMKLISMIQEKEIPCVCNFFAFYTQLNGGTTNDLGKFMKLPEEEKYKYYMLQKREQLVRDYIKYIKEFYYEIQKEKMFPEKYLFYRDKLDEEAVKKIPSIKDKLTKLKEMWKAASAEDKEKYAKKKEELAEKYLKDSKKERPIITMPTWYDPNLSNSFLTYFDNSSKKTKLIKKRIGKKRDEDRRIWNGKSEFQRARIKAAFFLDERFGKIK